MEPECTSPCTQQPVAVICPEPDDCTPQPHNHFSKMNCSTYSYERLAVLFCHTRTIYCIYVNFIMLTALYEKAEMTEVPVIQFYVPFLLLRLSSVFSVPNPHPYCYVQGQASRIFRATRTIRVVNISVSTVFTDWLKVIFIR
jgi:hypothetical protein